MFSSFSGKMNLPPIPKTPIRTPQTGSSTKSLQLTPIWETVVKSRKIPSDVNENSIFQEISSRLEDLEWPVRQHAFRVLYDIIPIVSKDKLDERIIQNDILSKLVTNLGHPAPGVRKVAMETIRQYMKQTRYSEKMLESFVIYGVREGEDEDSEELGIVRENVILGTIMSLVDILKPFIFPDNGGYAISEPFLNKVVAILAEKMKSPLYREKCAETLCNIREMIGEHRFLRSLDHLPDGTLSEVMRLRDLRSKLAPEISVVDVKPVSRHSRSEIYNDYSENPDSDQSFELELASSVTTYHNYKMIANGDKTPGADEWSHEHCNNRNESTEEYSDGTDTDTYTKETAQDEFDPEHFLENGTDEQQKKATASFVPIENKFCPLRPKEVVARSRTPDVDAGRARERDEKANGRSKTTGDSSTDSAPPSPRVVLETEIQFSEDKAIKMTIVEDEKNSTAKENEIDLFPMEAKNSRDTTEERRFVTEDGDLIMKILHNSENEDYHEEEIKRTPRRVRFGGEVIKLRTPDSDGTDVTVDNPSDSTQSRAREDSTTKAASRLQKAEVPGPTRPETKVPPKKDLPRGEEPVAHVTTSQSHIPLPVSPATRIPLCLPPAKQSPSKKGSGRARAPPGGQSGRASIASTARPEEEVEDASSFWRWTELGLVGDKMVSDLRNENDWKVQYEALEELKLSLINPKTTERLGRLPDDPRLSSLFKFLLHKLPQDNQMLTALSISSAAQLIQILPKECVQKNVVDIVMGLCKYVGGCKNLNLKIEAAQSLKMLFSLLDPSSVIDVLLDHCLTSSSSKMRENSLLSIMYATMTFPSNVFRVEKILERVTMAISDSRRKVRHAALEAVSILSQFCSSESLTENVSRVAATLPNNVTKSAMISAVKTRLCRRLLPTVSNEGLVLYSLQIPASRRFGNMGSPSGADVDWILSGTGSISTGSAKSRGQLNAAQRLDLTTVPFSSPKKWSSNNQSLVHQNKFSHSDSNITEKNNKISDNVNPWTMNKNRTGGSCAGGTNQENWKNRGSRFSKNSSTGSLAGRAGNSPFRESFSNGKSHPQRFYASEYNLKNLGEDFKAEVSWALIPVTSLEEQHIGRMKHHQLWGEFGIESGSQYLSSQLGTLRPLYLKLQPTPENLSLSRSTEDVRRSSFSYSTHKASDRHSSDDFTQIRVLTPSMLREKNSNEESHLDSIPTTGRILRNEDEEEGCDNRIPQRVHQSPVPKTIKKLPKTNEFYMSERKLVEDHVKPNGTTTQNGKASSSSSSGILFPVIHNNFNSNCNNEYNFMNGHRGSLTQNTEIDENKIQDTMTQLNGLLKATSKTHGTPTSSSNRSADAQLHPGKNQMTESETILPLCSGINKKNEDSLSSTSQGIAQFQDKLRMKSNQVGQNSVASAPPIINSASREKIPSTSSSNSTDFGASSSSATKLQRLKKNSGALNSSSNLSCRSHDQKLIGSRLSLSRSKIYGTGISFPDNLKPFDRPKEGLETCFSQLESQQWEVVMLGLTSLVRLLRHHPATVLGHIHPVIMALGGQIRNLRSQVSRTACQAAAEMFVALKRNIETDLEELAGPLFHRSADTNRFIRSDCGQALDKMIDNVSPTRSINVIISKGSVHQNAIVRTVAARLLLRLTQKIGPEKILSLPREIRDKVVQTGANFLLEGRLETRAFAKELFRIWSSLPSFPNLMLDAIPPNVMRHISKTLISLKT